MGKLSAKLDKRKAQAIAETPRRKATANMLREILPAVEAYQPPATARDIDFGLVERMASVACTIEEISIIMGVHEDMLRQYPQYRRQFYDAYDKGYAHAKMSLRRVQFNKAMEGNPTMLIWLGKQLLNQRDRYDIDTKHGGAVEVQHALKGLTTEELRRLAGVDEGTETIPIDAQAHIVDATYEQLPQLEAAIVDIAGRCDENAEGAGQMDAGGPEPV